MQILWIVVQSYWIMNAQAEYLPPLTLPLGRCLWVAVETATYSKVQLFEILYITFSSATWPHRCKLMEDIYAVSKDCSFLIHAQQPPHASQNKKVDLLPVGQPVPCKYLDQR